MTHRHPALTVKLCLTALLSPLLLLATPQRGDSAAKSLAFTDDSLPTAADYIQDGLVAMWDGIENAGWGVHDDTATSLYELISGQVEISVWSTFVANADNMEVVKPTTTARNPSVFGMACKDALQSGFLHVEGIWFVESAGAYQIYGNRIGLLGGSFGWQYRTGRGGLSMFSSGWAEALDTSTINAEKIRLAFDIDSVNSICQYFVGNASSPIKSITISSDISPKVYIDNRGTRLYSVRAYSRPLSSSEIAYNLRIDRLRFNLP